MMHTLNRQSYLRLKIVELRRLLQNAGDDPILVPQYRERIEDSERELTAMQTRPGNGCARDDSASLVLEATGRLERELPLPDVNEDRESESERHASATSSDD